MRGQGGVRFRIVLFVLSAVAFDSAISAITCAISWNQAQAPGGRSGSIPTKAAGCRECAAVSVPVRRLAEEYRHGAAAFGCGKSGWPSAAR